MSKILIVDDDTVLSHLYENAFKHHGYEVQVASDGEEGLKQIGEFKPDLVLSDVMMPRLSGVEMLKKIKSQTKTKNIPIIIMSNLANEEDVQEAMNLGAVKHIAKQTVGPNDMVGIVKEILGEKVATPESDIVS